MTPHDTIAAEWQHLTAPAPAVLSARHAATSADDTTTLRFLSASEAVLTALRLQDESNGQLRVGVHVDDDGDSLDQARRLSTHAEAGDVLLSQPLRDRIVAGLDAELEEVEALNDATVYRARSAVAREEPQGGLTAHKPMLFMLPLRVVAGNRCDPVYAELAGYGINRALSQNPSWHLISRLSADGWRHRAPLPGELHSRLRATHVLSGSVALEGKQLRLELLLVESVSGRMVWEERLDHALLDLRAPHNPIGSAVTRQLTQALIGKAGSLHTMVAFDDMESYRALFCAMVLMHRSGRGDFERSHALLSQLAERHPDAAEPQAWLAKWHVMRVARRESTDVAADSRLAMNAVARARTGTDQSASVLAIDGVVQAYLLQNIAQAQQTLYAALAQEPNESLAWLFLSAVLAYQDQGSAAADAAGMALLLSPLDPMRYYYDSFAAHAMLAGGRTSEAIVLATRSLSANRRHLPTVMTLAVARMEQGQVAQAHELVEAMRRLDPSYSVAGFFQRYPGRDSNFARQCAQALKEAGLPAR